MFEGPVIIWAASRAPSAAEKKIVSQVALATGAQVKTIARASLGTEILSSIVQGSVVVIVDSRKDAASALRLGADETVRLEPPPASKADRPKRSAPALRKDALKGAIERASSRPRAHMPRATGRDAAEYPGLALLMRVVERQLGSPLNEAAVACTRLADELAQAVAVADGLMQRVRLGSTREELKGWSREVKQYAQATLRAESLVSELRGQVERGDAVMRLLGDSSPAGSSAPTDVGALLRQLAELLRADVSEKISLELLTTEACFVQMARPSLLCIVCGAIEIALDNIRATAGDGHLQLRASKSDTEALIEVTDDGVPGATDLRASIVDSLLADPRTARLRQLRERVRAVDGELAVDADEGGSVVSIYLPLSPEVVAQEPVARVPSLHLERRNH